MVLVLLSHHPIVSTLFFYSKSDQCIYVEFSFHSSLCNLKVVVLISCFLSLMKGLLKIFVGNHRQSKVMASFFFWKVVTAKKKNRNNSYQRSWFSLIWFLLNSWWTGLGIRCIWEKKYSYRRLLLSVNWTNIYVGCCCCLYFGYYSQLLEGSLKFTFLCWYVHNTSKDGFHYFLQFCNKLGK